MCRTCNVIRGIIKKGINTLYPLQEEIGKKRKKVTAWPFPGHILLPYQDRNVLDD